MLNVVLGSTFSGWQMSGFCQCKQLLLLATAVQAKQKEASHHLLIHRRWKLLEMEPIVLTDSSRTIVWRAHQFLPSVLCPFCSFFPYFLSSVLPSLWWPQIHCTLMQSWPIIFHKWVRTRGYLSFCAEFLHLTQGTQTLCCCKCWSLLPFMDK